MYRDLDPVTQQPRPVFPTNRNVANVAPTFAIAATTADGVAGKLNELHLGCHTC